jgi:hypothetical protein
MSRRAAKNRENGAEAIAARRESNRGVAQAAGSRVPAMGLQRAAGNRAVADLVGSSSGRPLDPVTKTEMESRFGQGFEDVRVHSGAEAESAAEILGADAWTSGRDIVFGEGQYAPGSSSGKKLLAHELAHVVQQRRGGSAPRTFEGGNSTENDASHAAAQFSGSAGPVSVNTASGTGVARQEAEEPWWKKRLNPLYQKALDVLPKEAAEKLEAANAVAKHFVEGGGVSDQTLDQAVRAAEPILGVVSDSLDIKKQDSTPASPQQAQPAAKKNTVRTDYPADENAYSGTELEYTAHGDYPVQDVVTPGVYHSSNYWLAPHLRAGTNNAVYYLAYNPETKRNEYVIGPGDVQNFLDHEDLYLYNAAASYPLKGELPEYKAQSGRVAARLFKGDYSGAFKAWKASWSAAVKDPQFWVETVTATAGAVAAPEAGMVGDLEQSVAPVKTAATDTEGVFAELNQELQSVPAAPGELKGTSTGGFESPRPLQPSAIDPEIKTPAGVPVRESAGASTRGGTFQSASAQTRRSLNTAIHADVGEVEAYKSALARREIGLQRPEGSNAPGVDFITAVDGPDGIEIFVNDAKTSTVGKFPAAKGPNVKPAWQAEVDDAVSPSRLKLGDPQLEARIRAAAANPAKVHVRQINVDYSPSGGGGISGF